jgi:hypothetical protein
MIYVAMVHRMVRRLTKQAAEEATL